MVGWKELTKNLSFVAFVNSKDDAQPQQQSHASLAFYSFQGLRTLSSQATVTLTRTGTYTTGGLLESATGGTIP